jgi:hypothetical protein
MDITHDFDEKDYALLQKIDAAREKQPELAYQIYQDVMKQEQWNIENGMKTADNSYQARMKAALVVLAEEKSRREALTKILVAREKGGAPVKTQVKVIGNKTYVFNPVTSELIYQPGMDKPVTKKAPVVRQTNIGGIHYVFDQAGNMTDSYPLPGYKPPSSKKPVNFYKTRAQAVSAAQTMWAAKDRPNRKQAYDALMAGYGNVLLGAGYKPETVRKMINNVIKSVSAARWDKVGSGSTGSSGPR